MLVGFPFFSKLLFSNRTITFSFSLPFLLVFSTHFRDFPLGNLAEWQPKSDYGFRLPASPCPSSHRLHLRRLPGELAWRVGISKLAKGWGVRSQNSGARRFRLKTSLMCALFTNTTRDSGVSRSRKYRTTKHLKSDKGHQMKTAKTFEDLVVWQKAHQLVIKIYKLSKAFPKDELFGLTSQLRRAAVSIPANIVEGFKRTTIGDKLRYFNIAQSSLEEVRYYLILSSDLGFTDTRDLKEDLEEVSRMLEAYMKSLRKKKWLSWILAPGSWLLNSDS